MRLWKRIKNLWALSAYRVNESVFANEKTLVKDFTTVERKLATIIKEKSEDIFPEDGTLA